MGYFLFAAETVVPTVCILLCGYGARKRGLLTKEFIQQGDRLCFSLLFPLLVFWNLYQGQNNKMDHIQYGKVILLSCLIVLISAIIGMLIVPKVVKERTSIPVIIQSLYRGNFMLYGLPFSEILGGTECLKLATAMTAATLPLLNIIAIFQFSYYTGEMK